MSLFRTIELLKEGRPDPRPGRGGRPHRRTVGTCSGCRKTVFWCLTSPGLKAICFDVNPEPLDSTDTTETVSTEHVHWASCPARDQFRRRAS